MSEDIRKTIDKFKSFKQFVNENVNNNNKLKDNIIKFVGDNSYFDYEGEEEGVLHFSTRKNGSVLNEKPSNKDISEGLYNHEKLKRIITKHLRKKPFTNNADWGGGYVWNIETDDNFLGTFLYLGDDELVVIKRTLIGDEYNDEEIKNITNSKELYNFLLSLKK